jgi:hypothetical protein
MTYLSPSLAPCKNVLLSTQTIPSCACITVVLFTSVLQEVTQSIEKTIKLNLAFKKIML